MAREFSRTHRIRDFLKKELANLIQQEMRDPRVGMVSITDVEVSRDLSHAKVFCTVLGKDTEEEAKESIDVLNQAAGFLRTQIARVNNARTTPRLKFYFDNSVGRGQYLSGLIDQAVSTDQRLSAQNDESEEV